MEQGFKPTTHGREVIIACMSNPDRLELTRVAFGKGLIPEDADLADQHELVDYVADGAVADRRHDRDRLMLTLQYSNGGNNKEIPTFYLREFMVYARNPDTGQETDLLYGTLGDYAQPVPKFHPDTPPAVYDYPLTIVLSDEINVSISAPAGLVTYGELTELVRQTDITIPADGWTLDENPESSLYPWRRDIAVDNVSERMIPQISIPPASAEAVRECGLYNSARTTLNAVRVYAVRPPTADIPASLLLLANPPYVRSDGTSEVLTTESLWNASPEEMAEALGI